MADVTPFTWILAAEAVVSTMAHWAEVGREPVVVLGDPSGDLSRCGCEDGNTAGQVLVTAGPVFFSGEQFPQSDILRRQLGANCADVWATEVTVDFARCRPVFAADGRSQPTPATVKAHAEALYADGQAIWKALLCAQAAWRGSIAPVVVDGWQPIQRDLGPCGGFSYRFTGRVGACDPCEAP